MTVLLNNVAVNIASGSQDLGPANVPNGLTSLKVTLARCTTLTPLVWPNVSTTISVSLWVSLDGGTTWLASGQFTSSGGIALRDGAELVATIFLVTPIPTGAGRKGKTTVAVTNGPFVSTLLLEAI